MKMKDFTIYLSSDLSYEKLVAEIQYKEETVAIINQDKGPSKLKLEIFAPEHGDHYEFDLKEFLKVINKAKEYLEEGSLDK